MTDYFKLIAASAKTIPSEVEMEEGVSAAVEFLETNPNLTEDQQAFIVGLAALLYRQGLREFEATGRAADFINRVSKG